MANQKVKFQWGDDWGDDDEDEFPVRQETPVDEHGFKRIIEFKKNEQGEKVKVTTTVKIVTDITRTNKRVFDRKSWAKFGAPAAAGADESNITFLSGEEIRIEHPDEADTDNRPQAAATNAAMAKFWEKQRRRQLERQMGLDTVAEGDKPPEEGDKASEPTMAAKLVASGQPGKYVPPSLRNKGLGAGPGAPGAPAGAADRRGMSMMDNDRDQATLRVTNISEDTSEQDLRDLFSPFGKVFRIFLAKNRETMQSRGFAFVSFFNKADAQAAMDELQGFGYDHLILKLEWAKPSKRDPQDSGLGSSYTSGYGKALAQETKEKVSYTSNLTV